MDRRHFIVAGTVIWFLPAPSYANPAVIAAAEAAAALYGKIQEHNFKSKVVKDLAEIKRQLNEVSGKLDTVLLLLQQLPNVFAQQLLTSEKRQLEANILGREDAIFSRAATTQGKKKLAQEVKISLGALADQQATVRGQLATYGVGVYPILARAFATEIVALRAMRDQQDLFEIRKTEAIGSFDKVLVGLRDSAAKSRVISSASKNIWSQHTSPTYVGDLRLGGGRAEMFAYVDGSYDQGVTTFAMKPSGYGIEHKSALISYDGRWRVPYGNGNLGYGLRDTLNKATSTGKTAERNESELLEHIAACEALRTKIAEIKYIVGS
jgi:hypothetical protein